MTREVPTNKSAYLPPLLPPAAALVFGIAAGRGFTFFPYTVSVLTLMSLAALLAVTKLPIKVRAASAMFLILGFAAWHAYGPGAPSLVDDLAGAGQARLTGRMVRPPQHRVGYTVLLLENAEEAPLFKRPGRVRVTMSGDAPGISYGDVLSGRLELYRPEGFNNPGTFDWGAYALVNGVDAVAKTGDGGLAKTGSDANPILAAIYSFRDSMTEKAARSLSGPASGIFRAIILGDQGAVTQDMRDAFAASGTTHILSVSGSHIALLSAFIYFLVKRLFLLLPAGWLLRASLYIDSRKLAAAVTMPAAILYCLLAGAEVATVRSVIMVCVYLTSKLIDRDDQLLNTLCAAAISVLAVYPSSLFDISFRLSYLSVLFMALALKALEELKPGDSERLSRLGMYKRKAFSAAVLSVAAIAATAPLAAGQFNSFSYAALPSNLVLLPVAGAAAVPAGLITCVADLFSSGGALPLAWLNQAVMGTFYRLVELFGSLPSANLHPPAPGPVAVVLYYSAMLAALTIGTDPARKAAASCLVIGVFAVSSLISHADGGRLRVTVLDVGQGGSCFVEMPDGTNMLVDAGGSEWGIDPGRATVAPFLWNRGVRSLDYVVASHPHPDHVGGLAYILDNFPVGQVWEGGMRSDRKAYREFSASLAASGADVHLVSSTGEMDIGGAAIQIIHCPQTRLRDSGRSKESRENNRSVVLRIAYGDVSVLICGDIERQAEAAMLEVDPPLPLRSTVMTLPHHGSSDAALPAFMEAVSPEVAIASTGARNRFGHPSPDTVRIMEALGARVYNTASDGAVTIETDGSSVSVSTCAEATLRPAHSLSEELWNLSRLYPH